MRIKSLLLPACAALAVAAIALALGHGRGGTVNTAPRVVASGKTARLRIANYAFAPQSLTVTAGTTVIVANADATAHTATARSGAFDSGTLNPGQTKTITFTKPGVYPYFCQFHAFMTGTITVVRR